ncbi:MAG: hypothetical protein H6R20_1073 [Proteobacteria bacterium]|nr:hypothetical protein [Pseudomonadota bacterium]
MVHEAHMHRVVQAGALGKQADAREQPLGGLVAVLGEEDRVRLLVHPEIARTVGLLLPLQEGRDLVHAIVELGPVLRLAGDDERRARLVDQDRVHLVDDGVAERPLHAVRFLHRHVVAQVVETVLVIGAVGHVGGVRRALRLRR